MGSLFGGDTAKKSQAAQQAYANTQSKKLGKDIKKSTDQTYNMLLAERDKLANAGFGYTSSFPGYNVSAGSKDGVGFGNISRTGETQGFMDRLLAGLGADESSYQELLSQIRPGFGRLSKSMQEQVRNSYAQRYGDLREQLGRRRVLGSSFANADLERMNLERDQQMRLASSQAMVEELKMTGDVLKAQSDSRNETIKTAFSQIQFEGNMGIQMANMVMASQNEQLQAQQDLIKLAAGVKMQGTLGAANVQGGLAGQVVGSFPGYAELQSQIDAGPMNFLATALGAGATAYAGRK